MWHVPSRSASRQSWRRPDKGAAEYPSPDHMCTSTRSAWPHAPGKHWCLTCTSDICTVCRRRRGVALLVTQIPTPSQSLTAQSSMYSSCVAASHPSVSGDIRLCDSSDVVEDDELSDSVSPGSILTSTRAATCSNSLVMCTSSSNPYSPWESVRIFQRDQSRNILQLTTFMFRRRRLPRSHTIFLRAFSANLKARKKRIPVWYPKCGRRLLAHSLTPQYRPPFRARDSRSTRRAISIDNMAAERVIQSSLEFEPERQVEAGLHSTTVTCRWTSEGLRRHMISKEKSDRYLALSVVRDPRRCLPSQWRLASWSRFCSEDVRHSHVFRGQRLAADICTDHAVDCTVSGMQP